MGEYGFRDYQRTARTFNILAQISKAAGHGSPAQTEEAGLGRSLRWLLWTEAKPAGSETRWSPIPFCWIEAVG